MLRAISLDLTYDGGRPCGLPGAAVEDTASRSGGGDARLDRTGRLPETQIGCCRLRASTRAPHFERVLGKFEMRRSTGRAPSDLR